MAVKTPKGGKPIFAITLIMCFFVAVALIVVGTRISNGVLKVIGIVAFAIMFFILFVFNPKINGKNSSSAVKKTQTIPIEKANRYYALLIDERTKQNPDVQRLLQYPAVQKVFFEPSCLNTVEAAASSEVTELLALFDEMLTVQQTDDFNGAAQNINVPFYSTEMNMNNMNKGTEQAPNKTKRTIGRVLYTVGILLFILPFLLVFIPMAVNDGNTVLLTANLMKTIMVIAPISVLLTIVGAFLKR